MGKRLEEKVLKEKILFNVNIVIKHKDFFQQDWYDKERRFLNTLSTITHVSPVKVYGIYSALSPLKSVEQNRNLVVEFLLSPTNKASHTGTQVGKAREILNLQEVGKELEAKILSILSGEKTKEFFSALHKGNGMPIDRHMMKLLPPEVNPTNKNLLFLQKVLLDKFYSFSSEKQAGLWTVLKQYRNMEELSKSLNS